MDMVFISMILIRALVADLNMVIKILPIMLIIMIIIDSDGDDNYTVGSERRFSLNE